MVRSTLVPSAVWFCSLVACCVLWSCLDSVQNFWTLLSLLILDPENRAVLTVRKDGIAGAVV